MFEHLLLEALADGEIRRLYYGAVFPAAERRALLDRGSADRRTTPHASPPRHEPAGRWSDDRWQRVPPAAALWA